MHSTPLVRASISFPPDLYESLEEIATQKKVSLAWVVRDAAEKYVANETVRTERGKLVAPLLPESLHEGQDDPS